MAAVVVAVIVALAAGGVAVALTSHTSDPDSQATAAVGLQVKSVESHFAVFKNKPAATVPASLANALTHGYANHGPDVNAGRKVTASNGTTAYLVPSNDGLCAGSSDEAFCATTSQISSGRAIQLDLCSPNLPVGQFEVADLLPDGKKDAKVVMHGGRTSSISSDQNVYIQDFPVDAPLPEKIEWTGASGLVSVPINVPADVATMNCLHPSTIKPPSDYPTPPPGVGTGLPAQP